MTEEQIKKAVKEIIEQLASIKKALNLNDSSSEVSSIQFDVAEMKDDLKAIRKLLEKQFSK